MIPFIRFKPLCQERVWGGRRLETSLGRSLPPGNPVGESWEIVDRPEAQSVVEGGPHTGSTLRQLIEARPAEIMGPGWPTTRRFPILVKWLDCADRLSLQVHPPASVAAQLGGEPKTENWYFLETNPGASVLAGLREGCGVAEFARALEDGTVAQRMVRHTVCAGDSLLIRSGVMHAIEAGNLILEIQQNSDTTYRVYDWGRTGLDGKPRALHVRESLASLAANTAPAPQPVRAVPARETVRAECAEFRITRRRLAAGETLDFPAGGEPRILSVVEGGLGSPAGALRRGDNVLLPYSSAFSFAAPGNATVLVTDHFNRT